MDVLFSKTALAQYIAWQNQDRKTLERINELIKDIVRNGVSKGIGKPERLRNRNAWSRRIDEQNRILYRINEYGYLYIISCKGHYD